MLQSGNGSDSPRPLGRTLVLPEYPSPVASSTLVYLRRIGSAGPLADAIANHPDLAEWSVSEQQHAIDAARGPFSAPVATHLRTRGWHVSELILGVPSIREAWIRENGPLPAVPGVENPDLLLALAEIRRVRPTAVLDINLTALDRTTIPLLRRDLPELKVLAGRMGTTKRYHKALHLDLSLVPCGAIAEALRPIMRGAVEVLPHSFDPGITTQLPPRHVIHPLLFAGALGPRYSKRHEVLMELLSATPIEVFLGLRKGVERTSDGELVFGRDTGRSTVAARLPIRVLAAGARRSDRFAEPFNTNMARRSGGATRFSSRLPDPQHLFPRQCHPPVAGRAYLEVTRCAGTVVHREGDDLDGCGGALRLFEVTGVGAALLTDDSPMVRRLFEPDEEVIVYRSPEEAVKKARWLLDNPEERERIAAAGHARTLRDHTTERRVQQLDELLRAAIERQG